MSNKNIKKIYKTYNVSFVSLINSGNNNDIIESKLEDVIEAMSLVDAYQSALKICDELNKLNSNKYEVETLMPIGGEF